MRNKVIRFPLLFCLAVMALITGCKKDFPVNETGNLNPNTVAPTPFKLILPSSFPPMPIPKSNPLTNEGVALGKKLFYDPLLSANNKQACATCHQQSVSFVDSAVKFSKGVTGVLGGRNSMPIYNVGYASAWFWDGRAKTLEEQIFHPITSQNEMNQDLAELINELNGKAEYKKMFIAAFGAGEISFDKTSKAIAQFMRTIIAYPAKSFDTSKANTTLNVSERRGLMVFLDEKKGDCFHCHELGNFMTNYKFTNNGLNINAINDPGLYAVTRNPQDLGKFRTPSLINIKFTSPYMHDGRFKTLREVINFYDTGFHFHPQTNYYLDPNLQKHFDISTNKPTPRTWTEQDKQDLINFLNALIDESIHTNKAYSK
ncbi:MAG: cytochrome-c peroxidase [Bacteroidia bacterium]